MSGRLGIDFGTSNTVVAVWDTTTEQAKPVHVSEYGRQITYQRGDNGSEDISIVPSLIHYASADQRWLGNQVRAQNVVDSDQTFRWMKRYISNRSLLKRRLGDLQISHFDAGREFLSAILVFTAAEFQIQDEEVAFTVPVEAYEHYEDWLADVANDAGMPRMRLIDEPSAAALGYGAHVQPGNVYLVFDFGGGTLDVVVVVVEESDTAALGRRCRVLGKAGESVGGITIDQHIYQAVLRHNGRSDSDEDVRQISRTLLVECERAKERLSTSDAAEIGAMNPDSGAVLGMELTRSGFEDLLDEHDILSQIDRSIRRALNTSRESGYSEEHIHSVLMVGGSSIIPCVRRTVQRIFGRDRVLLDRPLDAVARGAAAFVSGVDFYDHIQHSYAIRYIDPKKGDYAYRELVPRGTPYPSQNPVAQMTIKASFDGQTQLGIAIYEMGEVRQLGGQRPMELVFDPSGAARVMQVTADEEERRTHFWINENNPTFLPADPAARQGEARFDVEFDIDGNKRLLITARDTRSRRLALKNVPVVKLT